MSRSTPHVIHLVPALFDEEIGIVGGAERYALELARYMARRTPTRLLTFAPEDGERTLGELTVELIGHPHFVRGQRSNPFSAGLFKRLNQADVVHCHQLNVVATTAAAAYCRATGRRVYVTDLGGGGWGLTSYINTQGWFNAHLHISQFSQTIAAHKPGIRSSVILGGVDTLHFSPADTEQTRKGALFVGRILPHKGIDTLINALPPKMRLDIVGRVYHQEYYDHLRSIASGKQVHFATSLNDSEIIAAYRRAACVVLPSVYRTMYGSSTPVPELLGQTLLEGMACGLPAICTNVGAMPEVVADGITGFVVPGSDVGALRVRLEWIRDNPEQAHQMGLAGRQRALELFTWEKVVEKCLAAYCR